LKAGPDQVQAITTADYPLPAPRPAYSMLESNLLAKALQLSLPSWQAGVDSVLRALRSA
jgi:dTDP-4-dehydrorhamnose reductase